MTFARHIRSLLVLLLASISILALAQSSRPHQLDSFNQKFTDAIRHMDNAAVVSLWADDGVSLLPGMDPISSKPAIQRFMDNATSKTQGYKVISHDNDWHDIHISGDWASEWALTKQVVQPPGNKPPLTIRGKMLLVLHRDKEGAWKIEQESWTSSPET